MKIVIMCVCIANSSRINANNNNKIIIICKNNLNYAQFEFAKTVSHNLTEFFLLCLSPSLLNHAINIQIENITLIK